MNQIEQRLKFLNRVSFRGPIALFVIFAAFVFLFLLVYKPIPGENRDLILFASGLVLGMAKEVSSFYFGSSKDKADADKTQHVKSILGDGAPQEENTDLSNK